MRPRPYIRMEKVGNIPVTGVMRAGEGRRRCRRRGMTLAEVLMALMITALIATTVTAALAAVSYGTSSQRDWRRLAVREYKLRTHLQESVCRARAVLASGTTGGGSYLVLWKGDREQADDKVNLSEIQYIAWVEGSAKLSSYEAQSIPDPDPAYEADADFYQIALQKVQDGTLAEHRGSEDVTAFEITVDAPGSQAAMLTWTMQINDGSLTKSLTGVAALRGHRPPE